MGISAVVWTVFYLVLCLHTFSVSGQATSVSVRLVGGTRNTEGRVEVFYNGTWGTICDDGWNDGAAAVICRMLTFNGHYAAHSKAYYGSGRGQIWLDDVRCTGREPTIAHCGHSAWGTNNCEHNEDAGVDCDTDVLANLPIRLVGGNNTSEGRLEIQYNNEWGTVCDDKFGNNDARVVCNQLHHNSSIAIPVTDHRFGSGQGKIWMDDVACNGSEKGLGICKGKKWNKSDCDHTEDVGVICRPIDTTSPVQIRLASGLSQYEGRVEIRYGGVWGTVCDDGFETPEAQVACRMAGFSGGTKLGRRLAGPNVPIWLDDVECVGNETSLVDCVHKAWGQSDCSHTEDIAIRCSPAVQTNVQVRLAGGRNSLEGRVEVFYKGQWGTVCDDLWGVADATVVCRMLHLSTSGAVAVKNGFPGGTGQIWLDDLRCRGTENSLADCPASPWGQTNCQHNEDAGVRCQAGGTISNNVTVRLVGGPNDHEGRVEVLYKGNWGTVCDDYFGATEAKVVCRMLGFQTAGAMAFPRARFGRGQGGVLLDDVRCTGDEQSLDLCRHLAWGHTDCDHSEDVSVKCPGGAAIPSLKVRLVGGLTRGQGRVEVQKPGTSTWGTVCDDGWTTLNAQVVCRMLGLPWAGAEPRPEAFFGQGTGQILLDQVQCTGNESNINECRHDPIGTNDCRHNEDVGVICQNALRIHVRLTGGVDTSQGRVEVLYNHTWGSVCDTGFGNEEAAVVCRMLGFNQPGAIPLLRSFHGHGTGPVYFDDLQCLGSERSLINCASKGIGLPTSSRCRQHTHDAGVKCNPGGISVRLRGGAANSGRLEINILGTWDTVCDDRFSVFSAAVACRMLGLNPVGARAVQQARYGRGTGKIALDDVICRGNETSLLDCRHSPLFVTDCQHTEDVSVICGPAQPSTPKVRLAGGMSPNDGRVEIFYNNTWGTVCDDGFTTSAARVVCRWLNISAKVITVAKTRLYGSGRGPIYLDDVRCVGTEADLWHCRHRGIGVNNCGHGEDVGISCLTADMLNSPIRLVNGSTSDRGRVEIFFNNTWGTVCDDNWGVNEARAVCRKLGKETRYAVPIPEAYFGMGSGSIVLDDVVCNGTEPSLTYCRHKPFGQNDCEHSEDAGVICLGAPSSGPVKVRLAGGLSVNQGRVEILYHGIWGTISDDSFDSHEAVVICKMLGYQRGGKVLRSNLVGSGSGPIWLDDVYCTGTETNIGDCRRKHEWGEIDVSRGHAEDAGVVCSRDRDFNFTARLVNGPSQYEGRVELFYHQWGTVCDDQWDNADAAVVCSMLGFGTDGARATTRGTYGRGNGSIILDDVQCVGTEANLAQCPSSEVTVNDCDHSEDAGVICSRSHTVETNLRVRLVNGHDSNSGRVEVFYNNQWGTVCDDAWNSLDAQVVCRMLGKASSGAIARGNAYYQRGSGKIWLDDVHCNGNETSLSLCRHAAWGRHNCGHSEDAGVECRGTATPGHFRLVGNTPWSGRLEVLYNGRWGTVCDDSFGVEEAQVACRSLGFRTDGAVAHGRGYYGRGSGTIVLDDVVCRGQESDIFHCRHSSLGHSNCGHSEDVGVTCPAGNTTPSNETTVRLVNGPTPNQGRVEIKINGTWGTVCDDVFGSIDAGVVCAMLGYPRTGAVAKPQARPFGRGSGPIWLDDVTCRGHETSILECSEKVGRTNCDHSEDVGVVCSSNGVGIRLAGGPNQQEGRVEIQVNGTWGTICDDSFTTTDAQVICKMLGYPYLGATFYGRAHYGQGTGRIWLDSLRCSGRETTVLECRSNGLGRHDCHHTEDVGVVCSNHRRTIRPITRRTTTAMPTPDPRTTYVRLANGPTAFEGRVEIFNNGVFGTVCDHYWDTPDASVVCQMLGYSRGNAVAKTKAAYGEGTGRIWLDYMRCVGTENYLSQCRSSGFRVHSCGHQNDAGVKCSSDSRPDNFLLILTRTNPAINRMDLNTYSYVTIPHDAHSNPVGIAYDPVEARVYWTDTGVDQIRTSNLDGSGRKTLSQLGTRSAAESIAVDSFSRNVYYADRYSSIIGIMTLDGQFQKTLIRGGGLYQPRGITVHAQLAIMFWADWGRRPKIEKSNLDGTGRTTIVSTSLRYPNAITIGYQERRIYWCDSGIRQINMVDFNGGGRRTLLHERRSTSYLGIVASRQYLYYTDSRLRTIMRIGKNGLGNTPVGPTSFTGLTGIAIQERGNSPFGTNACSRGKGGCAYICVPTPDHGKKCLCPDGLTLQTDGVSCLKNSLCPRLTVPTFGTLSPSACRYRSSSPGTVCTASCNPGFTLSVPTRITCQASGQWSTFDSPLKCTDSQAPNVTCPQDMTVTADKGNTLAVVRWNTPTVSDNSRATVTVVQSQQSPATLREGRYTVFVTATDTSGHSSSCTFSITVTVKRCSQLSLPAHAYLATSCSNHYGSTCPLQCQDGYTAGQSGKPHASCDMNNAGNPQWTLSGKCQAVSCSALSAPSQASISGCSSPYKAGSVCSQSCQSGYRQTGGSASRQCLQDGTWGGQPIVCTQEVTCNSPAAPQFGGLSCQAPYPVGKICTQTCTSGYVVTGGNPVRQCLSSGQWSGTTITCQKAKACKGLTNPSHGKVTGCVAPFSPGAICSQSCNGGFVQTSGTNTRQCKGDGTWSGQAMNCIKATTCPLPVAPINGKLQGCKAGSSIGAICLQKCNTGFVEVTGRPYRQCKSDGTWNGQRLNCTKMSTIPNQSRTGVQTGNNPPPGNNGGNDNTPAVIILAVLVSLIILASVIAGLFYLKRRSSVRLTRAGSINVVSPGARAFELDPDEYNPSYRS